VGDDATPGAVSMCRSPLPGRWFAVAGIAIRKDPGRWSGPAYTCACQPRRRLRTTDSVRGLETIHRIKGRRLLAVVARFNKLRRSVNPLRASSDTARPLNWRALKAER
jgi:hypothetical protein